MSKKLVAYFSASGVTTQLAKTLAQAVNGDLYEIKPEQPYTAAALLWQAVKTVIFMRRIRSVGRKCELC